ncbi:MAG: hypothetical protein KY468_03510 [Armatimonadetes bacterium]|nr:hypothetical protein [Armatimonadota bacterium]
MTSRDDTTYPARRCRAEETRLPASPASPGRPPERPRRDRRGIAGQSIIMAVMVLFLLMFLGGIFIAVLRRNVNQTARHGEALNAQQLAEAGLEYADLQLSTGVEGADWRPEPFFASNTGPANCSDVQQPSTQDIARYQEDPDFRWIRPWAPAEAGAPFSFDDTRAEPQIVGGQRVYPKITVRERGPTGGFSRVTYGGGRYLVRVTYNPNNDPSVGPVMPDAQRNEQGNIIARPTPLSRYIMIESIGREGIVDPDDPTTYVQQSLRRQLVAFKPIGIVDYARFITDKDRTGSLFTLGASRFPLIQGEDFTTHQAAQEAGVPGLYYTSELPADNTPGHRHKLNSIYGPVRSNGGLRIKGEPMIVLNQYPDLRGTNNANVIEEGRGDKLEVVGEIERHSSDANLTLRAAVPAAGMGTTQINQKIWQGTASGQPNNIPNEIVPTNVKRIEAPDITAVDPTARVPRYRLLTRFSTPLRAGYQPNQSTVAARNGLGSGIYIDNRNQEHENPARLQAEWLTPASNNWSGNIYNPPGVTIQLLPGPIRMFRGSWVDGKQVTETDGVEFRNGLIKVTRDRRWRVPKENDPADLEGQEIDTYTMYFQYPLFPGEQPPVASYVPTFGNGVIFAEGNIRIWGKLPQDRSNPCFPSGVGGQRLTIVSNGTIYLESSLLKGDPVSENAPRRSGLAIMAKDYVTVNATGYFMANETATTGDWSRATQGNEWSNKLSFPTESYSLNLWNAVNVNAYPTDTVSAYVTPLPPRLPGGVSMPQDLPDAGPVQQGLFTQTLGESSQEGAGMQMQVNANPANNNPLFHPWWQITPNRSGAHFIPSGNWSYEASPLHPFLRDQDRLWHATSAAPNFLRFSLASDQPARIAKVAVAPLDVRIEAAIYAQDGSFFVIPGVPLNNVATDTRAVFVEDGRQKRHGSIGDYLKELEKVIFEREGREVNLDPTYPYPFNDEPLDVKLLVLGAVAENKPASEDAQEAWAKLWGWTPLTKAAPNALWAHGGDGLSFQFDADLRAALRFDRYGRPLPLMPRLPTSPDMIFSGEAQ